MNLADLHTRAQALLAASSAIAPFAPYLVEDNITNFEEQILNKLDESGVCIVLGDVAAAENASAAQGRRMLVEATLPVFVFDNPMVDHSPSGMQLIDRVVAAFHAGFEEFTFQSFERGTNEKGAALTILTFTAKVIFNP